MGLALLRVLLELPGGRRLFRNVGKHNTLVFQVSEHVQGSGFLPHLSDHTLLSPALGPSVSTGAL